ncbi:MAG: ABC transporter transmembrane domain-containing protein [Phycisphaerae bacterium]
MRRVDRLFSGIRIEYRRHRTTLLLAILAAFVGQALTMAVPLLARGPIDALATGSAGAMPGEAWAALWIVAIAAGVLAIGSALLSGLELWLGARFSHAVLRDVRVRLLDAVSIIPPNDLARRGHGAVILRFIGDAGALQGWLSRTCVSAPADVLALIGAAVAIAWLDWVACAVLLPPALVVIVAAARLNRPIRRWSRRTRREQGRLSSGLMRGLTSSGERSADTPRFGDELGYRIEEIRNTAVNRARIEATQAAIVQGGFSFILGLVLVVCMFRFQAGHLDHGSLTATLWLLLLTRAPSVRLARGNVLFQRARVARSRIRDLTRAARRARRGSPIMSAGADAPSGLAPTCSNQPV